MTDNIPGLSSGVEALGYLRPYLRHCGESERPAWRLPSRKLLDFLLVYIDDGTGRFVVGGDVFDVVTNDLCWIPPDTPHDMEGYGPRMACTYLHFDLLYRPDHSHWDFSIPGGMLDLGELKPLMHPPLPPGLLHDLNGLIRGPGNRRVAQLMHEACRTAARGQPFSSIKTSGLITQLVGEILSGQHGLPPQHSHSMPGLEEAAAYLREHCTRNVQVDEAAEVAGLSGSYFRRLFGMHFGCSPREYIRNSRIQLAKRLLMEHRHNITEIAERCGFATVHSFSRAFRDCEGKSPSDYRRRDRTSIRVEGQPTSYPR